MRASHAATSAGLSMSTKGCRWKLPSPTCPTIGATSPSPRCPLRLGDAFRQAGDRNADIGGDGLRAGAQAPRSPIAVVTRLPEGAALLRLGGPLEGSAAVLGREFAEALRLLLDARGGAVKLEEQRASRGAPAWRTGSGPHLDLVEELDAGHGSPAWMVRITASQAALSDGKGQMPAEIAPGSRQLQRQLGDDAERPLGRRRAASGRSRPADSRARRAVFDDMPVGRTTVRDRTFSFMVP